MPSRAREVTFLLYSHETPPGVMYPVLGPPTRGCGYIGMDPESQGDDQKSGAPLLSRQAERVEVVPPRDGKAPGALIAAFPYLNGTTSKLGRELLQGHAVTAGENGCKTTEGRFMLDIRKKFFIVRVVRHGNKLPREAVDASALAGWMGL
ncbi:hypothetical protein DUI87_10180 [Hirundo rustica rustica]|uniref:Uncharacterized protein n=1 Tax=Hirundo rustica rustica TaxID=333673 RepID=A0A3M0KHX5_HIRRU|nr:hypothetical protein DUI87_10180 [Hirundo rustica rustica]